MLLGCIHQLAQIEADADGDLSSITEHLSALYIFARFRVYAGHGLPAGVHTEIRAIVEYIDPDHGWQATGHVNYVPDEHAGIEEAMLEALLVAMDELWLECCSSCDDAGEGGACSREP